MEFIGYNLPLIYGIERVRLNYYLWLFKEKGLKYGEIFAEHLQEFEYYFQYLKNLNEDNECDKKEFNIIFYQFILEKTEVMYRPSLSVDI